jgi:hypothetical protein
LKVSAEEIVKEFRDNVLPKLQKMPDWSRVVLEHFCRRRLGKGFDFCVSTRHWVGGKEKKWIRKNGHYLLKIRGDGWRKTPGEYLVDLCWYKTGPEYYTSLAMEVEWQPSIGYVDWDFYKLLDVKAPLKVWVSYVPHKRKEEFKRLEKACRKTRVRLRGRSGKLKEEYLIILLYKPRNKPYNFEHFIFEMGRKTKAPSSSR